MRSVECLGLRLWVAVHKDLAALYMFAFGGIRIAGCGLRVADCVVDGEFDCSSLVAPAPKLSFSSVATYMYGVE